MDQPEPAPSGQSPSRGGDADFPRRRAEEWEPAIARVKAGSVDDYRSVVAAFHARLRAALAGICPPGVDSDEIAHRAFIHAYRQLGDYRANTNFYAWLSAIARNLLLAECERLRRQARNNQNYLDHTLLERWSAEVIAGTPADDPRAGLLRECVQTLAAEDQTLLRRRYEGGTSVAALAEHLGRSASAISVQLFGIRKKLRECVARKLRWLDREAKEPGKYESI